MTIDDLHLDGNGVAGWLVEIAWASVGFAIGIVTRNVGATIGIGLVWTLLVENVLGALLGALDLDVIRAFMLGPASAALQVLF